MTLIIFFSYIDSKVKKREIKKNTTTRSRLHRFRLDKGKINFDMKYLDGLLKNLKSYEGKNADEGWQL